MPEAELRVYVVWLPVLSRMSPEARLGEHYTRALALPMDDPAWDVYLVFGPAARWEKAPPAPAAWMHQLGAGPREKHLDAKKLAETLRGLLPAGKAPGGL